MKKNLARIILTVAALSIITIPFLIMPPMVAVAILSGSILVAWAANEAL